VPLLNKLTAEDVVKTPSVFQLMPHRGAVKFLDENLQPLPVDLYDVEVWKRYGWSVIYSSPNFRRQFAEASGTDGRSENMLDVYLAAQLRRARRFQEALDSPGSSETPVVLLAIGGDCEETLSSPVLLRDEKQNRWITLTRPREYRTVNGVKISKQKATEAMYRPGDGRVTRGSLLGENIFKQLTRYAVFGCDLHGQLPRNPSLQDNALTAIVGEVMN
jgi:hypothetical protein